MSGDVVNAALIVAGAIVLAILLPMLLPPFLRRWFPNTYTYDVGLYQMTYVPSTDEVVILNTRTGNVWKMPRTDATDLPSPSTAPAMGWGRDLDRKFGEGFRKT